MKGSEVKKTLKANGFTQSQVARLMGLTPMQIIKKLSSDNLSFGLIEDIAKAIGKDSSFFFNGGKTDSKEMKEIKAIYKKSLKLYEATLKISKDINRALVQFQQKHQA